MKIQSLLFAAALIVSCNSLPETEIVHLYDGPAPLSEGWTHSEASKTFPDGMVNFYNVADPTLEVFRPSHPCGTGMLVIPGGAFQVVEYNYEGTEVAKRLCEQGITAFVLKYRTTPALKENGEPVESLKEAHAIWNRSNTEIIDRVGKRASDWAQEIEGARYAYADADQAMRYLRSHMQEYGLGSIGIVGFSAGAMMALNQAQFHEGATRPDFIAVVYGGWNESFCMPSDPMPMFMCSPTRDLFELDESLGVFRAWRSSGAPAEYHLFDDSSHGFGARTLGKSSDGWMDLMYAFMRDTGFLK